MFTLILTLSAFLYADKKPNIVYILADDLGIGDLSCYGQEKLKTPNIDRIAKEGMQFYRHYSGATVCAPSRSSLMTGLHTGHCPIRGNKHSPLNAKDGNMHMPADIFSMPKMFKDNNYKAGIFGKWGLGAYESESFPTKIGFDRFYGYNDQTLAHSYYPKYLWSDNEKVMLRNSGKKGEIGKDYSADLIQGELIKFIKENKSQPFFVYYAMTLPHSYMTVPDKYLEQFKGKYPNESKVKSSSSNPLEAFAGMLYAIDTYVGQIFETLEAEGILDNTIVIFTSDNGAHSGDGHNPVYWNSTAGLRGIKRDLYEGGIRTPMLVYWKDKVKAGSKTDLVSAFWDVLPSFADIIDAKVPDGLDGISFLPTLLGESQNDTHDYLYWEFHEKGGKQAILQDDWKLIRLGLNTPKNIKTELYNLKDSPTESDNVYSKNPEKARDLEKLMDSARTTSPIKEFNFKK